MTATTILPRFPLATPLSTPDVWHPPAPTTASRLPPLRSRGSSRGAIRGPDNRIRVYESFLEARVFMVLAARHDVAQIDEQPAMVRYLDAEGRPRKHTFDFMVTRTNGERIAVSVKPAARAEKKGLLGTLKFIASQLTRDFADRVILITEASLDRVSEFNAFALHSASHCPETEDDAVIQKIVAGLDQPLTISQIAALSGLQGRAFWPLVRLIGRGVIALVEHVKITGRALVRLAHRVARAQP